MDDENEQISISLDQIQFWQDDRIRINKSHSFWSNELDVINLSGEFVEDCLWTPKLHIKNLNHISVIKPTPTSSNGSPMKVLLGKSGTVQVESRHLQITVSCYMDFSEYPFDQQV